MASDMCEKNPFYNEDSHMAVLYKQKNNIFLIDLARDKIEKVSGNLQWVKTWTATFRVVHTFALEFDEPPI